MDCGTTLRKPLRHMANVEIPVCACVCVCYTCYLLSPKIHIVLAK